MTIKEWKAEMNDLVNDFQFHAKSGDLEKLKELVAEAGKIADWARHILDEEA